MGEVEGLEIQVASLYVGNVRQSDILVSQIPFPLLLHWKSFSSPPPSLPEFKKCIQFLHGFQCNLSFLPLPPPFAGWAPWVLEGHAHLMVRGLRHRACPRPKAEAGPQFQTGNYWGLTHQPVTDVFLYRQTHEWGGRGEW